LPPSTFSRKGNCLAVRGFLDARFVVVGHRRIEQLADALCTSLAM
jgi:hypothetical protein